MKLELKHIAFYLPYGLKCQAMGEYAEVDGNAITFDVVGAFSDWVHLAPEDSPVHDEWDYEEVFPILKPFRHDTSVEYANMSKMLKDIEYLASNHVDVFGLIDAGLAIDINTLK